MHCGNIRLDGRRFFYYEQPLKRSASIFGVCAAGKSAFIKMQQPNEVSTLEAAALRRFVTVVRNGIQ